MARTVSERADLLPALSELFRERGFEGASLSLMTLRTGLGRGSLYHFFPGGKEEMASWVLGEIDDWFEQNLFKPLREDPDPVAAIRAMFHTVDEYSDRDSGFAWSARWRSAMSGTGSRRRSSTISWRGAAILPTRSAAPAIPPPMPRIWPRKRWWRSRAASCWPGR